MLHLLDTNIIIALFANEPDVRVKIAELDDVAVPNVVLGELYFGARRSGKIEQNVARVDEFALSSRILSADKDTASLYGIVKARLLSSGRPIPENDIWIGTLALQLGAKLVTRDDHFRHIDSLVTVAW